MTSLVYGNAIAVHDPDPRALDAIERGLPASWTVSRPTTGWLLAVAGIGDVAAPRVVAAAGATAVFVEDDGGRCDPATLHCPAGDVTAIVLDESGARIVRSCAGTVPIYVARRGRRVAISTLVDPLVSRVLDGFAIDGMGLAAWVSGYAFFPDGRTWLRDVTAVPAGHTATVGRDGVLRHTAYWDPQPDQIAKPDAASRAAHAAILRTSVLATIERTIDRGGRNLLTLSGGADSTLLAYLIAGRFGAGLSTLSFRSAAPGEAAIEESVIGTFAAAHPPVRQWVYGSSSADRIDLIRGAPPIPIPLLHPALQVLPSITAQQPVAVLIGGEFADHVTGAVHHFPDWVRQTSPAALLSAAMRGALPDGPRDAARWLKQRLRPAAAAGSPSAAAFLAPAIRDEFAEWTDRRARRIAADPRPWRTFAARMDLEAGVPAMNWEACCAAGVLRVMPFLSRATLENVYACHAGELVGPGVKRLMRAAFAGDAPAGVLARGKYGGSDGAHPPIAVLADPGFAAVLDPSAAGPFDGVEGLMIEGMNRLWESLTVRTRPKSG